ncbi:ROK family protein [Phycicoccus avicenniae]|uniref:ROK family protein n=1 Tax=Phycicoccus avicenniae TaxID=2828860 RepID=UPI003D2679A9
MAAGRSLAVVADVGGTKVLLRAVDERGTVRAEERHVTGPEADGPWLDRLIGRFVDRHDEVGQVAVAVPGLVDADHRVVLSDVLPRLAGWSPVRADLVVNDVRAALAAVRAEEPGVEDLAVVVVGTGIAAAVLTGGRVLTGVRGWAGELGSVPVDLTGGSDLRLDDVASGRAIVRALGVTGEEVARRLAGGDPATREVVSVAGSALGRAVGSLVTLLAPARVVLAGGTTRFAGYAEAALAAAADVALPESWAGCRVGVDADPGSLVVRGLTALALAPRAGDEGEDGHRGQARRGRA